MFLLDFIGLIRLIVWEGWVLKDFGVCFKKLSGLYLFVYGLYEKLSMKYYYIRF